MKKLLLAILFTGVFMSNASASEKLEWKEVGGEVLYHSEIEVAKGIAARVELNGVEIASAYGDNYKSQSSMPQYFLQKGKNKINIYVKDYIALPNPTNSPLIRITFYGVKKDGSASAKDVVLSYENSFEDARTPKAIALTFNVENAPPVGRAVPETVARLSYDDQDKVELLMQYIIDAIKAGDSDAYFDVIKYSVESNSAKSYEEYDEEKERAHTKKTFGYLGEDFGDVDFNVKELSLIGVNNNKYFVAQTYTNKPFIYKYEEATGFELGLNLAFSKAPNGAWYVSSTLISPPSNPRISAERKKEYIEEAGSSASY